MLLYRVKFHELAGGYSDYPDGWLRNHSQTPCMGNTFGHGLKLYDERGGSYCLGLHHTVHRSVVHYQTLGMGKETTFIDIAESLEMLLVALVLG